MPPTGFKWITIEGFKSIKFIEKLPLRPINLLIGANGSGKSNFLEAFVLLEESHWGNMDGYLAYQGGAEKVLHFGSKTTRRMAVSTELMDGSYFASDFRYNRIGSLDGIISPGLRGGPGTAAKRYQFHDTGDSSPLKRTNAIDDNRFLRADGSNLAAFLYLLREKNPDAYWLIRNTVQQVSPFFDDFQLAPLARNPDTIKLEWRHKASDAYWDASSFSDGSLRFIALATLFLQPEELRPAAILIDEPELGLHPVGITLLASLIRQASVNTQVIAATQSPRLVDHFDPEEILVANRRHGATTIERLKPEPLATWLDEYSLGELWEKAEFAGRPARE